MVSGIQERRDGMWFFSSSPNCRCEISKSNCTRNLAVEKTISELPIQCEYCFQVFLRSDIRIHQTQNCSDRYAILLPPVMSLSLPSDQPHVIILSLDVRGMDPIKISQCI